MVSCRAPAILALSVACAAPDTRTLTVASEFTGETYALEVLSPEGSSEDESLPVVWVLDGHYHFEALARHVHKRWKKDDLAPFRLVGVSYDGLIIENLSSLPVIDEKRTVDLAYPESDGEGGGGDLFQSAMTLELVPAMEEVFTTDPEQRTLMGHSLGGYYTLTEMLLFAPHDSLFTTIVSASPSAWWDQGVIFEYEEALADHPDGLPFHLVIGTGTLEGTEMNATKEAVVQRLRSRGHAGLRITEQSPKAGHMEAAEHIFEDALDEVHP